jgi:hypothetical protein
MAAAVEGVECHGVHHTVHKNTSRQGIEVIYDVTICGVGGRNLLLMLHRHYQ